MTMGAVNPAGSYESAPTAHAAVYLRFVLHIRLCVESAPMTKPENLALSDSSAVMFGQTKRRMDAPVFHLLQPAQMNIELFIYTHIYI